MDPTASASRSVEHEAPSVREKWSEPSVGIGDATEIDWAPFVQLLSQLAEHICSASLAMQQ